MQAPTRHYFSGRVEERLAQRALWLAQAALVSDYRQGGKTWRIWRHVMDGSQRYEIDGIGVTAREYALERWDTARKIDAAKWGR